jgi:hypothetical protein
MFIEIPNIYEMALGGRCRTTARIVMAHQIERNLKEDAAGNTK